MPTYSNDFSSLLVECFVYPLFKFKFLSVLTGVFVQTVSLNNLILYFVFPVKLTVKVRGNFVNHQCGFNGCHMMFPGRKPTMIWMIALSACRTYH